MTFCAGPPVLSKRERLNQIRKPQKHVARPPNTILARAEPGPRKSVSKADSDELKSPQSSGQSTEH
jgi:hypothetical protein